jgi:putative ABC transport system permease protein
MIRLFFKMILNNRRRNVLLFIELFVVALVLVNLSTYCTERIRIRTIKSCYDATDVIQVHFYNKIDGPNTEKPFDQEKRELFKKLKISLKADHRVESVSFASQCSPFYYSLSGPRVTINGKEVHLNMGSPDIEYADVMRIKTTKGRWFNNADYGKSNIPIVISKSLEQDYFNGQALGEVIEERGYIWEVVGIVDEFKRSNFEEPRQQVFQFNDDQRHSHFLEILIRVKPGEADNYLPIVEQQIHAVLNPEEWTLNRINSFENIKDVEELDNLQRRYVKLVLGIFALLNVLLGIIGILWYNTNLRIHEIGVKRALGANLAGIKRVLLLENLTIGGSALMIVSLLYFQLPDLRLTKVEPDILNISLIVSIIVMIILITISTLLPASIAAKIRPAEALKTE